MAQTNTLGIFIPDNGVFKNIIETIPNRSINGISEYLGYHPNQVYTYFESEDKDSGIINIIVEIFTSNIIFILTQGIEKLDVREVNHYLRNFTFEEEYSSYSIDTILENGVEEKSLNINFLAKVLNITDYEEDGMYYAEKIDMNLFFINGILVSYQSANGLNYWAKFWRTNNPQIFSNYEKEARHFWGDNIGKIIDEINLQADAWAETPQAMKNEFIILHETDWGTINFAMLLVSHYNHGLTTWEFKKINYGRFKELQTNKYRLNKFIYEFSEEGKLVNSFCIE